MNWIPRYVAQVKSYLPGKDRDDVAEELTSLLEEKIADREDSLGRPLDQQETFTLLQEFGHPLKVASAYRASGPLISEALFPLYVVCIRYLVIIQVALYAVSLLAFYVSGQRDLWPHFSLVDLFNMGMFYFGAITLGFHITDRYLEKKDFLSRWNPRELPREDAERVSLFTTVTLLIIILAWFRLLSYIPVDHTLDELLGRTDNRFTTFVLWLKLQAILCVPIYVWLLLRPYWSNGKRLLIIASDLLVATGIIICLSIDSASFARQVAQRIPEWDSSVGVGTLSTVILSFWMLGVIWDIADHGVKIWRSLR